MLKVSTSLREIISSNAFLKFGLHYRLFNISQLTKFIRPLVETRTKKQVGESAILMGLSRLHNEMAKTIPDIEEFKIINLTVNSNLCSMTYVSTANVLNNIHRVSADSRKKHGYQTLSQGTGETTIIINEDFVETVKKILVDEPKNIKIGLSSLSIKFDPKYNEMPGFFFYILQHAAPQGISIYEISSTFTELILYVEDKYLKLLFDTIYSCFKENILSP